MRSNPNIKIKSNLNERKWYHRITAFALVFSVLMAFVVPLNMWNLIKPGFADSGNGSGGSDKLYFETAQTTVIGTPITEYDYTIVTKGGTFDKTSATPLEVTASPDTSIDLSLKMNYVFSSKEVVEAIEKNGGYIYYVLPENMTFEKNYVGSTSKVKDSQYANKVWGGADVPSGYYSIWNGVKDDGTKTNPILVIHFTPAYVEYFSKNNYLEGTIQFDGKINRADTVEGDQIVNFANGPTINIDFEKDKVTVGKENAVAKTDASGKYFEWKVTVTNPSGRTDLTGYSLSDKLDNEAFNLTAENCTVDPAGDGSFVDGAYVFSGKTQGQYAASYTFTYRQDTPTPGKNYKNVATLTGGDKPQDAEATGNLENKYELTKQGKPDYQMNGVRDGKIYWEVNVNNKSGNSLAADKSFLIDPAFSEIVDGSLEVKDNDGNLMTEGTDYEFVSGKVYYKDDSGNLIDVTDTDDVTDAKEGEQFLIEDGKYLKINIVDLSKETAVMKQAVIVDGKAYYKNWNGEPDYSAVVKYYTVETDAEGNQKIFAPDRYNANPYVIPDSNIINSPVMKFIGDSSVSGATVTYATAAPELGNALYKDVKNSVYTGSESTSPPKNDSKDVTVTYKKELAVSKQAADGGFDPDTETFKWQLRVIVNSDNGNSDSNNFETIDGYLLKDPMFAHLTEDEIKASFNAILNNGSEAPHLNNYVVITKTSDTEIKITLDKDALETAGITDVISGINLRYDLPADVALTPEQLADYRANKSVTVQNTATAEKDGYPGYNATNGIGITAEARNDVYKAYVGNDRYKDGDNYYVRNDTYITEQDITKPTRELFWKISLTKDNGFSHDDVILTDELTTLTSDVETSAVDEDASVPHYMTQDQLDNIVLRGKITQYGEEVVVTKDMYNVIPGREIKISEELTVYAGFEITFNEEVDTAKYRYINVEYSTTADVESVPLGDKTVFGNTASFGGESAPQTGLTFEHEDKNKVRPTTLRLDKRWNDNNNAYSTRPSEIKVKVLRAKENTNDWEYITPEDSDEPIIYTVPLNGNMVIGEFPQWVVVDGQPVYYMYKVEEILESNSPYQAQPVEAVKANNTNTSVTLTNNLIKAVYGKTADQPEMSSSQITKVKRTEIGVGNIETEVEYYLFKWKLDFNLTQDTSSDTIRTFTDTMPNGFIYVTDEISNGGLKETSGNNKDAKTYYNYKDNHNWGNACNANENNEFHNGESITASGNTITFKLRENISHIEYYTMIRADELPRAMTNGVITNKIRLQEKGETDHIATVTITDEPETDNENIKKTYHGGGQGVLRYALDFNPDGKKLSNTRYVDITDTLTLDSNSLDTADILDFSLTNLTVYEYNPDGTYTEISKSDYRYTVNYSHDSDTKTLPMAKAPDKNEWTVQGWKPGQEVSVSVSNANIYYAKLNVIEYDNNNQEQYHDVETQQGNGSVTFTIGPNTNRIVLREGQGFEANTGVVAKVSVEVPEGTVVNTPAVLHLEVPDQKYLRIEYTYNVRGYTHAPEGSNNNTNVIVSNTASFETANAAGYDSSDHNAMNVDDSSATSNTKTYPEIYKVDANSLSISNLAAKFKVLMYDKLKHEWVYAKEIKTETVEGITFNKIEFAGGATETAVLDTADNNILEFTGDTEVDIHTAQLNPDTLYKFIEIEAPEGYRQPPDSTNVADYAEFTYYYSYALKGDIPAELNSIKDKFIPITQDGRFDIPNSKCISVSAEKVFSGKAEDIPDNAKVQLLLEWSYNRDGSDLMPIGDLPISSESQSEYQTNIEGKLLGIRQLDYTKGGDNTVTWNGLPDAINGKPVYYFVKEMHYSYTKDGNTVTADLNNFDTSKFKPIYTNNGTNSNGDKITVNNAGGLVIRKEWKDINGNTINPPNEPDKETGMEIGFILTAKVKATDEEITLAIDEKLTPDNNYEYAINVSEKISDTNGNEYYVTDLKNFQITENLTPDQQFELGDDYVSSPAYELSNNLGLIKLINTSTLPTSINVSVQKIWRDNRNQSVKVRVIKTTTPNLTSDQIAALVWSNDNVLYNVTLTPEENLAKTWENLPTVDENGQKYYYYVQEYDIEDGITATYEVEVSKEEQKTTIINSTKTQIVVEKQWSDSTPDSYKDTVTVQLYRKTNNTDWSAFGSPKIISSASDWSAAFTGIDKTDANNNAYQYKVEEVSVGGNSAPGNVFNIAYSPQEITFNESDSSKTIIVTNTLKTGKIKIKKEWEMNGEEITETAIDVKLTDNKGNTRTEKLTKADDSWEWVIDNLPLYAADGTQLKYTVEEIPIPGYNVTYNDTNLNVTPSSNPSSAVTITNTYTKFTMKIEKDWDGKEAEHADDMITVVIHRSKTQMGDNELPLIKTLEVFVAPSTIVIDDTTATLTAKLDGETPDAVTYEVFNDSGCTEQSDKASISGNVVTPVSEGEVWIRAKSGIYTSKPVKLTIKPEQTVNQPEQTETGVKVSSAEINDSEYYLIPVDPAKTIKTVKYTVNNSEGTLVAHPHWYAYDSSGSNKVYDAWHDKWTDPGRTEYANDDNLNYSNVSYIGFMVQSEANKRSTSAILENIEIVYDNPADNYPELVNNEYVIEHIFGSDTVSAGSKIVFELKGSPHNSFKALIGGHLTTHTNWEWSECTDQPTVQFDSDGNATVEISFDADFLIRKFQVQNYYGSAIKVVNATLIPPAQPQAAPPRMIAPTSPDSDTATSSIAKRITRIGRVTQAEDIIEDNTDVTSISEAIMMMAVPSVRMLAKSAPDWGEDNTMTITISASDGWIKEIPLENDERYYYWIEETFVTTSGGIKTDANIRYDISYKFSDNNPETIYCIDSANPGSAEVTIKNTEKESPGIELPETGGTGTKPYTTAGMAIMLLSGATIYFKRRSRHERKNA